jgi:non-canonical purine NTP pyrophosphatase (RdgB/HAM1 family)
MKIKYVTGNQIKINFAKKQLDKYNIEIEQVRLEIDEIQSEDKFAVTTDKAQKAFEILKSPLFVTDTFWEIPALNGFPGAYMKYVNKWFSSEDFLALMKNKENRTSFSA